MQRQQGPRAAVARWTSGLAVAAALYFVIGAVGARAGTSPDGDGLAMHGEPTLRRTDPLPYADPAAPKGGTVTVGVLGTFDSLNPFNLAGVAVARQRATVPVEHGGREHRGLVQFRRSVVAGGRRHD